MLTNFFDEFNEKQPVLGLRLLSIDNIGHQFNLNLSLQENCLINGNQISIQRGAKFESNVSIRKSISLSDETFNSSYIFEFEIAGLSANCAELFRK